MTIENKLLLSIFYIRTVFTFMGVILLNAEESVGLFGWFAQPKKTLSWEDIKTHLFTWRQLRSHNIAPSRLRLVQPDKAEWINRGGLHVIDLLDMTIFPINPISDFGVDLAELWQMQCTVQDLQAMNVTYDQLIEKGLSTEIMQCFSYPLSGWVDLGFKPQHAIVLTDEESLRVFGMGCNELRTILTSFERPLLSSPNSMPRHS